MRKTFQIIGLISLTLFSFFLTEKTATVVNEMDEIMLQIKENMINYNKESMNAVINNDTIIPGIRGQKVNINKSYKNMKRNGYFSGKLYIYDYVKPEISLEDNKDKYIEKGNPNKRMVSLIFTLKGNENIEDILEILNNYSVKSSFFVDYEWYENNNSLIKNMTRDGHIISPLFDNYTDPNFEWLDMVIKKVNKQKVDFCYIEKENKESLEFCTIKGNYTIRPTAISDTSPLVDIKSKLEPGSILKLNNNKELKRELPSIIIYIKSKGYNIVSLEDHILE